MDKWLFDLQISELLSALFGGRIGRLMMACGGTLSLTDVRLKLPAKVAARDFQHCWSILVIILDGQRLGCS